MNNRVIDAKTVLTDIRSGSSDIELMKKYGLSTQGLQNLFRKLQSARLLKCLNGAEVARDIRAGLSRDQIMTKYELSEKGLEALFREIERTGLLRRPVDKDEPLRSLLIYVPQVVKDIREGMDRAQLLEKYRLSSRGLRWMTMMLITTGSMSWEEVFGTICTSYDELVPERLRATMRYTVDFRVPVYEINRPEIVGTLRDVSDGGIGTRGIQAEVGEIKTLVISGDEFGEYSSVIIDAECKWADLHPSQDCQAGFGIRHMSVGGMAEFQILIHLARIKARSEHTADTGLLSGLNRLRDSVKLTKWTSLSMNMAHEESLEGATAQVL